MFIFKLRTHFIRFKHINVLLLHHTFFIACNSLVVRFFQSCKFLVQYLCLLVISDCSFFGFGVDLHPNLAN